MTNHILTYTHYKEIADMKKEANKLTKKQVKKLHYKVTHKLLCPQCEGTTPHQLLLKHRATIPFLVKAKKPCEKCGYDGMFVEVSL